MFSPGKSSVTIDEIRHKVSEVQIASYYLDISEIPCVIKSPLRKDSHPSFGIYATADNRIRYKDYSTHETGGLIDLLSSMWGMNYNDTLVKIEKDMSHFSRNVKVVSLNNEDSSEYRSNIDIQVKVREWRDYDIAYWKSYGITLKWLKYAEVYPISHKIVTKDGVQYVFGAEKYAYVYVEHKDDKITLKIYQPYSKDFKWATKTDRSVWSLWSKIPKSGDNLLISSSMKDCLNLWCNLHIPAICMQGEGYLPKPHIIAELKSRFKNIIVFYDNDFKNPKNPGRTDSLNLCKTYGLQRVEIPEEYGCKDPSDLYLKYGKDKYMSIMKIVFSKKETYE